MRKPDFFIVGAPKCGTTFLYSYLRQHPQIFLPGKKEPHFFGTDLFASYFIRDPARYLSLFDQAGSALRVGEASVWYLYSKRAAREIKEFCPAARIIIMLRNPVDMIYSYHSQRVFNATEDIEDFESALNAEPDRKAGLRLPRSPFMVEGLYYREIAKFADQVKRYYDHFPKENVKILLFDDLKNRPSDLYRETLCFLDVNDSFAPHFKVLNPNKRPYSKTLQKMLMNPHNSIRRMGRLLMRPRLREMIKKRIRRFNTKYVPRSPMDPALRRRLLLEFAPEVQRLSRLLDRNLNHWCDPK